MTETELLAEVDLRLPSRIAAAQSRHRADASCDGVRPDCRTGVHGGVIPRPADDTGTPAPVREPGGQLERLQHLNLVETQHWIEQHRAGRQHVIAKTSRARSRAIEAVLTWLLGQTGETWDQRWIASGLDAAPNGGVHALCQATGLHPRWVSTAVIALIEARIVRPSYAWLLTSGTCQRTPATRFLEANEPDATARLRALPVYAAAPELARRNAESCIARVLIRTGKTMDELTGHDLIEYATVVRAARQHNREHLAWEVLVALGPLAGEPATLRAAWSAVVRSRQPGVQVLVDRYPVPDSGVRDLLVDYLTEVKTGMDHGSLEGLTYRLVRLFWVEVLAINPDQRDLRLTPAVATAWRERLATTLDGQPRTDVASTMFAVRALYRDLAEWSHEEPERWAQWVARSPVPRLESRRASKANKQRQSRMQARTRSLTPLLPQLVAAAGAMRAQGARLLAAASAASDGAEFTVDEVRYERHDPPTPSTMPGRSLIWARIISAPAGSRPPPTERGLVCVSRAEADGFWAWALIEVLRETGIRIEELLELTQLSLRHYVTPTTNTIVPLLHIVPSKTDAERLVPMSPDLVKVLVEVQRRARNSQAAIPLSTRYDTTERVFGDPLPHLFARPVGARQEVLSAQYVRKLLRMAAERADLRDAGEPVWFTPHDFRRLFATDLVGAGLPMHIVSSLLGHLNLETTRGYTAVFPEHVIQAHHAFIERRRQNRPEGELRPATPEEWTDFEQHFLLREVALGACHRPYATPCVHEHACTRCRFLQVDPAQLPRLHEMTTNAEARLVEAREHVWLGEVAALEESLVHLRRRTDEATALTQRDAP